MISINNTLIKNCLNMYENKSLYNNYSQIAYKYNKIYKETKDKKIIPDNQEKLREDVKRWLFSQSLENRMKICTVENELFGKILFMMLMYTKTDKTMIFKPKEKFLYSEKTDEEQFTKNVNKINDYSDNNINNKIKITKKDKSGNIVEAEKIGYSQSSYLKLFQDKELSDINLSNYFTFYSNRIIHNNYYSNKLSMLNDINSDKFFNDIVFFSVHHRNFPDCFTLSPGFLLEKEKFENIFGYLGNPKYFCSLIQPLAIPGTVGKTQKQYSYMLPEWFQYKIEDNDEVKDKENQYSIYQYAIAFFEQVIMIKYLLNKNNKKEEIFSLLDEQKLNQLFSDRQVCIDFLCKNYNNENRSNILKDLDINEHYKIVTSNLDRMKYVNYFKFYKKQLNCENSPYTSIIDNPYCNKYEKKYNRIKNIPERRNTNIDELTLEEIKNNILNIINKNDNIIFIDFLIFQNHSSLWKTDYYVRIELFEKLFNLSSEQNLKELIFDCSNQGKSSKKKHRKKNKKNNIQTHKEETNKISKEYEGKTKEEEDISYAPYYLKSTNEQKEQNLKDEKEIIKNFISKDIILGILVSNVFLMPLNDFSDYYSKFNKNEKNEQISEEKEIKDNSSSTDISQISKKANEEKENIEEVKIAAEENLSLNSDNNNISSEKIKNNNSNNESCNNNNENKNENKITDSKPKKKKEKEQTFFLFDTVKKKKKKIPQSKINININNALISNEFTIISSKEQNIRLSFFDKLHNDIIRYESKVISLLNYGMEFKDFCIKEIKRIIQETFTSSIDYNVDIYGSYATGLMIEASDIDIKIKFNNCNKPDIDSLFDTLTKRLESENKFDAINPIGTASVPVIKLLLSLEKFIKGKEELENHFKQYKDLSAFKHYIFDVNELIKIKIDITFISKNQKKINDESIHEQDKSLIGEMSSVLYVKEQIVKYPEVKFILRVLKRYFYYKKMNSSFLGGLSSYNLFLLLLSYAKFIRIQQNDLDNKEKSINLGYFLYNFLYWFKCFDFKQCVIDINSENIYNMTIPEKAKEFNFGKSIVIIDPLTGVNASKSSYKIDEINDTFSEAFEFFHNEEILYDKEGKITKVSKENINNVIGLPINNKNDNNHGGGGNIIEKFLGKQNN